MKDLFDPLGMGSEVIRTSPLLPERTWVQNKVHKKKPWMRDSYHRRIQKKWDKRFGVKEQVYILQTPYGFFVHPNTAKLLKEIM